MAKQLTKRELYEALRKSGADYSARIEYDADEKKFHTLTVDRGVGEYLDIPVPGWWGRWDYNKRGMLLDLSNGETTPFDEHEAEEFFALAKDLGLRIRDEEVVHKPLVMHTPQEDAEIENLVLDGGNSAADDAQNAQKEDEMSDEFFNQFNEEEEVEHVAIDGLGNEHQPGTDEYEALMEAEEATEEPAKEEAPEEPWKPTLGRSVRKDLRNRFEDQQILDNYEAKQVTDEQIEEMDLVKWRRCHERYVDAGIPPSRFAKAIGENRAMDDPIDPRFEVWYKGRIRYVSRWCLESDEALEMVRSIAPKKRAKKESAGDVPAPTGGLWGETRLNKQVKSFVLAVAEPIARAVDSEVDLMALKKAELVQFVLDNQEAAKAVRDAEEADDAGAIWTEESLMKHNKAFITGVMKSIWDARGYEGDMPEGTQRELAAWVVDHQILPENDEEGDAEA